MHIKFKVKFIIFDTMKEVSEKQQDLRHSMMYEDILNDILKDEFKDDLNYKCLDSAEASISSIDETKQLRLMLDYFVPDNDYALCFHQNNGSQYFTFEELEYISMKIKNRLEIYLKYKIDDPIIYISANEL